MALEKINKNSQGVPDGTYTLVSGGTLWADCPLGILLPFMGAENKIPAGWCLADGRALSRTKYADLFAIIGTAYGAGDGSTTFNIADMRESVPKGAGLTSKSSNHMDADGLAVGEFLDDRIQDHRHVLPLGTAVGGDAVMLAQNTLTDNTGVVENDYRKGATTEVKSVGVNYITRIEMVALPADFLAKVDEAVEEAISMKILYNKNGIILTKSGAVYTLRFSAVTYSDWQTALTDIADYLPSTLYAPVFTTLSNTYYFAEYSNGYINIIGSYGTAASAWSSTQSHLLYGTITYMK